MKRALSFLAAACAICSAGAFDRTDSPPLRLAAGDTLEHTLPAHPAELTINFRVACPGIKGVRADEQRLWSVYWNKTSPDSYQGADVTRGCRNYGSPAEEEYIAVEVYETKDGSRTPLLRRELSKGVSTGRGANSLDIDLYNRRLYLRIGSGSTYHEIGDIPYEAAAAPSACGMAAHTDCEVRRRRVSAPADTEAECTDLDFAALDALLRDGGGDAPEGYWHYYDRNTATGKATLGGYYSLAVVKSGTRPGAYDIIYLSGASRSAERWEPLRIKGRLFPSGYANEYDLIWYGADGNPAGTENSAQLTDSGNTLTLTFPMADSQIRFRREVNQTLEARPE